MRLATFIALAFALPVVPTPATADADPAACAGPTLVATDDPHVGQSDALETSGLDVEAALGAVMHDAKADYALGERVAALPGPDGRRVVAWTRCNRKRCDVEVGVLDVTTRPPTLLEHRVLGALPRAPAAAATKNLRTHLPPLVAAPPEVVGVRFVANPARTGGFVVVAWSAMDLVSQASFAQTALVAVADGRLAGSPRVSNPWRNTTTARQVTAQFACDGSTTFVDGP